MKTTAKPIVEAQPIGTTTGFVRTIITPYASANGWAYTETIKDTVKQEGEIVKLTATEYSLMALFAKNEGKVLTHRYILKEIWGVAYQTETQYLRVFIGSLRKKIEANSNHPMHIITESGIGYRFQ